MINVLFVCHGNICRSPMAEFIFKKMIKEKNLDKKIHVESRATSDEAINQDIHPEAKRVLLQNNVPFTKHFATQITKLDYKKFNYILCMDDNNTVNLERLLGYDIEEKISSLPRYAKLGHPIADPWYTGNFDKAYRDISTSCEALLKYIITYDDNLI